MPWRAIRLRRFARARPPAARAAFRAQKAGVPLRQHVERRADGRDIIYYSLAAEAEAGTAAAPSAPPAPEDAILVTGGAGYVAGPLVARLAAAGHTLVILDNLSTSSGRTLAGFVGATDGHSPTPPASAGATDNIAPAHPARPRLHLVRASVGDAVALRAIFERWRIRAIFHFAADSRVGESMTAPLDYFRHNVREPLVLLEQAVAHGAPPFIFSSSAAVYGVPRELPVSEDAPLAPINPYGETKAHFERILHWAGLAHGLPWAALRYFNAAGAEGAWEPKVPETHLIPNVLAAASGGPPLRIFGGDYPTPDGTAIRDYIHVADLAEGHLAALRHLQAGGASGAFNLGTGTGCSVAEVVAAVERVAGRPVAREVVARRPGDPAALVADPAKAERVLGWRARRSSLQQIVADAWAALRAARAEAAALGAERR